jgi:hypothetical protein
MAAPVHEVESALAWFECLECERMWSIRKPRTDQRTDS